MRRADRLFQIVQYFRSGRLITAAELGQHLEVSPRTIYRDIADLQASGVPIEGEAGVGYVLKSGFDLPPMMFNRDEVVSLIAGARLIQAWGGAAMARAALQALDKIESVLPDPIREQTRQVEIHAVSNGITTEVRQRIDELEQSIQERQRLQLTYCDAQGEESRRFIWPLGLWFWGKVWTLVAWCELRTDFRLFRIDRIAATKPDGQYPNDSEKSLKEFYRKMEAECHEQRPEA
ncbi:MAG: YafY family protein [Planctomycetota bacterium]